MKDIVVSVIVPTFNRSHELAQCLQALGPQIPTDGSIQVLILDDGRTVTSRDAVRQFSSWAKWHEGPKRGPAANRNRGAALARGKWLVFIDDDIVPTADFLQAYLAAIKEGGDERDFVMVGPTFSEEKRPSLLWEAPSNPTGALMISCNFAITRDLFWRLSGFDERFPMAAFEDTEFEARIRESNIPIRFVPPAAVSHPLRRVPSILKCARRWEARVIYALDLGAAPHELFWRIPEHVFKVLLVKLIDDGFTRDIAVVATRLLGEFMWVLLLLPSWVVRHVRGERSQFWRQRVARGDLAVGFGL